MNNFIEKKELIDVLNTKSADQLKEFVSLPVFNGPHEGLLFILLRLIPEGTADDMMKNWGVSKELADFLMLEMVGSLVTLGLDN